MPAFPDVMTSVAMCPAGGAQAAAAGAVTEGFVPGDDHDAVLLEPRGVQHRREVAVQPRVARLDQLAVGAVGASGNPAVHLVAIVGDEVDKVGRVGTIECRDEAARAGVWNDALRAEVAATAPARGTCVVLEVVKWIVIRVVQAVARRARGNSSRAWWLP